MVKLFSNRLYESPKAQPTPEQKLQSPWKWMEKGGYDELQQIRGNLASKFNQVNSDVTGLYLACLPS